MQGLPEVQPDWCRLCRNINYTNRCTYACGFCAFSKGRIAEELRGSPYLLPYTEISRRTQEAWARGASETCMQGGIHPDFTGQPCTRYPSLHPALPSVVALVLTQHIFVCLSHKPCLADTKRLQH